MKVAGSLGAVGVATALVYALKPIAPVLSLGVVYTLAVLAAAVLFGLAYATATAIVSMVAFNFLFLPPVHTLTLADGRNWAALGVYVVTAVVASELATSARRRATEAELREREAALLADAAAAVLREEPLDEIRARADAIDASGHARFEAGVDALLALADERRVAEDVRRSDAIKTVILQTVSHDFRTPIATISAAVGGLQDASLTLSPDDRRDLLETIALEGARLSRLVENVLDLSRLETGTAAPNFELREVDDVVGGAVAETSDASRLTVAIEPSLPPVLLDAVQVQRALVNLIENALKFSKDGVEVAAYRDDSSVALDVLDRGPGVDGSTSSRGLGLGLEIARGFAQANDGRLELRPREGGGTSARLLFHPAAAA